MASQEEPQVDDTRGLPDIPAPQETLFGQGTTDEETPSAAAEHNGEAAAPAGEPAGAVVSPARPRGIASFPGGPPPVSTPPPTVPLFSLAEAPTADDAPRFRVTTVESTAGAFRPAGPPPPVPPPAAEPPDRPAGEVTAEPEEVEVEPEIAVEAEEPREVEPEPAEAAVEAGAEAAVEAVEAEEAETTAVEAEAAVEAEPTKPARSGRLGRSGRSGRTRSARAARTARAEEGAVAGATAEAGAEDGTTVEVPAEVTAEVPAAGAGTGEPAARAAPSRSRRRRGRPSRAAAVAGEGEPGAEPAATAPEGAEVAAATGPDAVPEVIPEVVPDAVAAAPEEAVPAGTAGPAGTTGPAGTAAAEPAAAEGEGEEDAASGDNGTAAGSARTRARRRRRAAAKARLRSAPADQAPAAEPGPAAESPDPAAPAPDPATAAPATAAAPAGPASRPTPARTGRPAASTAERAPGRDARGPGRQRPAAPAAPAGEAGSDQAAPPRARGRRRRLTGSRSQGEAAPTATATAAEPAPAAAPAAPAAPSERSTRLEANRTRGVRQGADRGRRRRRGGLSEEQKRVLREGPERRMLVTEGAERTQIGVLEGRTLVEHYVTRKAGRSLVGNIYLGRVQNVLPGMEAAFVDIGKGRNAVLYAGEVNYSEEDLDGEAPRIEKALKPGQSILVQVTKDPIGAKGARLTTQVSLAGRYLVLQPEDSTFGISRRLPEPERARLREILKEVRPKGLGLIVRTAAEGATAADLRADLSRLQARWEAIARKARKASPPAVIYQEPELVVRVIRDIFSPDFAELVVDASGLYERVKSYLDEVAPDLLPKVRAHDGRLPLFEQYRVSEQIHKALERKVWLPSGGSLVIDQTEAMTVVDVNTGKYVGKSNLEETVVATNLEAAEETVRQLRLRDIGGIIIIDFIDMLFEKNQQAVVERLRSALARDKTKSQVMEVSSLGLVQMTRKRVSGGLLDSFSETCPTCEGRGVVITHEG